MKRLETLALSIVLLALAATLPAQENNENRYTFLLTGASFASPNNGWFEVGCQLTDATPLNRAIGGEAIAKPDGGRYTLYQRADQPPLHGRQPTNKWCEIWVASRKWRG